MTAQSVLATELRVNRKNTEAFIAARPTSIVLSRRTDARTGAGGRTPVFTPLLRAQRFRIIAQNSGSGYTPTPDGTARRVEFTLLGSWDADVQVGDQWEDQGRLWTVQDIVQTNGYELRAAIVQKGRA